MLVCHYLPVPFALYIKIYMIFFKLADHGSINCPDTGGGGTKIKMASTTATRLLCMCINARWIDKRAGLQTFYICTDSCQEKGERLKHILQVQLFTLPITLPSISCRPFGRDQHVFWLVNSIPWEGGLHKIQVVTNGQVLKMPNSLLMFSVLPKFCTQVW